MKKKIIISCAAAVILLAVLFVPIPKSPYDDGGTREYTALTYKIVNWNRLIDSDSGVYNKTRVYFLGDRFKSIDELWLEEQVNVERSFIATVLEINGNTAIVAPVSANIEQSRISFDISNLNKIGAGNVVKVTYVGLIREISPLTINAVKWELAEDDNLLERNEWLNKETAEKIDTKPFTDIVITGIYDDCFFARTLIPSFYEIKINGKLPEGFCVKDQVVLEYENTYYDKQTHRIEADLISINFSDIVYEPGVARKPVIYLYPESETNVQVKLTFDGRLTCTYPLYNDGWTVTAFPDGTLFDGQGQMYNYLYWEGETDVRFDFTKGFCVKGSDTAEFLEDALEKLGLTRREANEFIVYWLPIMQNNAYNVISFQSDVYTNAAKLEITPEPDTVIRVYMAWQASDEYVEIEEQILTSAEREGFTVVEWGGGEVKR